MLSRLRARRAVGTGLGSKVGGTKGSLGGNPWSPQLSTTTCGPKAPNSPWSPSKKDCFSDQAPDNSLRGVGTAPPINSAAELPGELGEGWYEYASSFDACWPATSMCGLGWLDMKEQLLHDQERKGQEGSKGVLEL